MPHRKNICNQTNKSQPGVVASTTRVSTPSSLDLVGFVQQILQLTPDPVQSGILAQDPRRLILNCSRQWGKSTITAAKAVHHAWTVEDSLTLIVSPGSRQSAEFLQKAKRFARKLDMPIRGDGANEISLRFPNGSRIVGLPASDDKIRGFSSVGLLLIDEAARVSDDLYYAVLPMLAASDGQLWMISTPDGRRGFFYETWTAAGAPGSGWHRVSVPASECSRIKPSLLAEMRRTMPAHRFRAEYGCEFVASEDHIFSAEILQASLADIQPICSEDSAPSLQLARKAFAHLETPFDHARRAAGVPNPLPPPHYFIGVDLGKKQDHSAICILERATVLSGDRDPYTYAFPSTDAYAVRYLERIPLETPYTEVASRIVRLVRHPDLGRFKTLLIDASGPGDPVIDFIRQLRPACPPTPVVITSGDKQSFDRGTWRIPRTDLLAQLEIAIENRSIRIASALPHAGSLLHELENLRRNHDGPEHDDLVMALALANWHAVLTAKGRKR